MGYIFLVHFDYPSFIGTAWHIDFFIFSFKFSACWIVSSDIETGVFGVATDIPGQFACVFNLRFDFSACLFFYRSRYRVS